MPVGRNIPLIVLLAEDEPNDVYLIKRALEKSGLEHTLRAVPDGGEAIRYLRGEGEFADRSAYPCPNLILSDLKMPGIDGFGLLQWLHDHPECSVIPMIILSASGIEADVRHAYQLGANAYMVKPSGLQDLVDLLHSMHDFWSRCERPSIPATC